MIDLSRPCNACCKYTGDGFYCCSKCQIHFCFYCAIQLSAIQKNQS